MLKVICSMMVVAVLADSVADELSDDKVKAMIVGSSQYIDNGQLARRLFYHAKDSCGTDTNRFARLLCELAQTNDVWFPGS